MNSDTTAEINDQETGFWEIPKGLDTSKFDFSWRPPMGEPPFIHQFGTQWQKTGGPRWIATGGMQVKYESCQYAIKVSIDERRWRNTSNLDFDYTWHPDETEPPMIYQFADQWYNDGGPKYVAKGLSTDIVKYIEYPIAKRKPAYEFWENIQDLDDFDLSWYPPKYEPEPYIYQFNSPKWHHERQGPKYVVPGAVKVKYIDGFVYRLKPLMDNWAVPADIDVKSFDFSWIPDPHEPEPYIYQFGTQWQKSGGPRYVVPGATKIKYIEDLKAIKLPNKNSGYWGKTEDIEFDWSWHPDDTSPPYIYQFSLKWNKHAGPMYTVPGATQVVTLEYPVATTNQVIQEELKKDKCWYIPAGIDDSDFDYSWRPHPNDSPYIYQFPTQWQKTGGPRYVMPGAEQLKYIDDQKVYKRPTKKNWLVLTEHGISNIDYSWHPDATETPYIYVFGNQSKSAQDMPTAIYFTPGAKKVKYVDQPIVTLDLKQEKKLDIIFISNGEEGAEDRFNHLCSSAGRQIKRISGVEGRENAILAAAEISETDWFFVVPAKLRVDPSFDWDFQPDRLRDPVHYIFYAKNPLNGLVYGHQAAICYNKQHVLDTIDYGLDFTMSKPHDVVPVCSGVAEYNVNPWITWRTAFREVIKLKLISHLDKESNERLEVWCTVADGKNAKWSLNGAKDALRYFDSVDGEQEELEKTFKWSWLKDFYHTHYGIMPD